MTTITTINESLSQSLKNGFVVFDLEWDPKTTQILAGSFVDSNGNKIALLIEDYYSKSKDQQNPKPEAEVCLIANIILHLKKYDYSFGWYSTGSENSKKGGLNSDLVMLDKRIKDHGFASIIKYNKANVPYINLENHKHIDAYILYDKIMIKSTIYNNQYQNNLSLDNVAKVLIGRGKYKEFKGLDFTNITNLEEKRAYVLEDSQLLYDILAKNNFEVLRLMDTISVLTNTPFDICCRSGLSKVWSYVVDTFTKREINDLKYNDNTTTIDEKILKSRSSKLSEYLERDIYADPTTDDLVVEDDDDEEEESEVQQQHQQQDSFEGGKVFDVIAGEHKNVYVLDVQSLYPNIIINYNISFDTVNCECCKYNSDKISSDIVADSSKRFWVCKRFEGIIPKAMKYFLAERLIQKSLKNKIMADGLKILINSGFGVMGFEYFKYENKHAAMLVAAYGRYILKEMARISKDGYGFNVIAGDTDSIFLKKQDERIEDIADLINDIKRRLNVTVEHEKTFRKAIMVGKKNYLGVLDNSNIVIKGLGGKKTDRVPWVRDVFLQMCEDYKNDKSPIDKLREAFNDLDCFTIKNADNVLLQTVRMNKDPSDYKGNNIRKRIGMEKKLRRGDSITFFLTTGGKGYTFNMQELSLSEYKRMLISTVQTPLQYMGYDLEKDVLGQVSLYDWIKI